jgi:hypothetical protein
MRPVALALILATGAALQADILHLRDGSRHYGELISENSQTVVFRIVVGDGSATAVKTFPIELVARVERTGLRPAEATRPATVLAEEPSADYEQMLREAYELLDDNDPLAALRALQRVVLGAPPALLVDLEHECRTVRGTALDELLARTRVQAAGLAQGGRAFQLRYATPYESGALGRVLAEAQETRLSRSYDGRNLTEWAAAPADYTAVRADTRALVADASRAAAVISARLRWDGSLKDARAERARLVDLHSALARLARHLLALPGYTEGTGGDSADDPATPAAESASTSQPTAEDGATSWNP